MDEIEATVFLHDNGQIFARRQQQDTYYMAEIDYPGKPCLPYRCLGLNETIETSNLPQIQTAHFVRIVPVEQGQDYTIISTNKGVRKESKAFASSEDMVIAVPCDSVKNLADLLALTDAEIIAGSGINHSGLHMMSSYTKPLSHSCGLPTVERTPDPRIYRQLSAPSPCLVATETMQIGYGLTFALAQPGDILMIKEKTNTAGRLIRKEAVADGSVQLINKTPLIPSARKFTGRRL